MQLTTGRRTLARTRRMFHNMFARLWAVTSDAVTVLIACASSPQTPTSAADDDNTLYQIRPSSGGIVALIDDCPHNRVGPSYSLQINNVFTICVQRARAHTHTITYCSTFRCAYVSSSHGVLPAGRPHSPLLSPNPPVPNLFLCILFF